MTSLQKAVEETKSPETAPKPTKVPSLQKAVQQLDTPVVPKDLDASSHHEMDSSLHRALEESKSPVAVTTPTTMDASTKSPMAVSASGRMQGTRFRASGGGKPRRRLGTQVKQLSQRFDSIREEDDPSFSNPDAFPIQSAPKVRITRKELEEQTEAQLARIKELEAKNKQLEEKVQHKDEDLKNLQTSMEDISIKEENLEELLKRLQALNSELEAENAKLSKQYHESKAQVEELLTQNSALQADRNTMVQQLQDSNEEVKRLNAALEEQDLKGLQTTISNQKKKIDSLEEQAKTSEETAQQAKRELEEANKELAEKKASSEKLQRQVDDLESEVEQKRQNAKAQEEVIKGLEGKVERLQVCMEDASARDSNLEKVVEEQETQIGSLRNEKLKQAKSLNAEIGELKKKLQEANRDVADWKATYKKQQQRVEDLEARATPLREKTKTLETAVKGLEANNETRLERINYLEAENAGLVGKLQVKEGEVRKIRSSVGEEKLKGTSLQITISEQKKEIESLQRELQEQIRASEEDVEELKQKKLETDRSLADLRTTSFSQQQKIESLEMEATAKDKTLEETVRKLEARNSAQLETTRGRINDLEAKNLDLGDKLQRSKEKVKRLQSFVDDVSGKEHNLEKVIEERENQIDSLRKEMMAQSQSYEAELGELKQRMESEASERIQALEDENSKIAEKLQRNKETVRRLLSGAEESTSKQARLQRTIEEQKEQIDSLLKDRLDQALGSEAEEEIEALKQKLKEANHGLAEWKRNYKKQQQRIDSLEREAVPLQERAKALEETVHSLENQNESRLERIQRLESENEELELSQRLQSEEVRRLQSTVAEEAVHGTGLDKTIEQQKEEMDALLEEVLALGDDEASFGALDGYRHMAKESSQDDLHSLVEELERSKHESLPEEMKLRQQVEALKGEKAELESKLHDQEAENAELEESLATQQLQIESLSKKVNQDQRQRLLESEDSDSDCVPSSRNKAKRQTREPASKQKEVQSNKVGHHELLVDAADLLEEAQEGGEVDALAVSQSEAAVEEFELAWMQQAGTEEPQPRGRGRGKAPFPTRRSTRGEGSPPPPLAAYEENSAIPALEIPSAVRLRRCNTSELVREHRNRRPTVLMESNEIEDELDESDSDLEQKDWSKPSLRTPFKTPKETGRSRAVPNRADLGYQDNDMDASFSNSEAIAEQFELAWFQQQQEQDEKQAQSRQYSSTRNSRRRGASPPPLAPYGKDDEDSMPPAYRRQLEDEESEDDGLGLPREVLKRLEAVHRGDDMDASFTNSEAIAEQFELAWMHQADEAEAANAKFMESPYAAHRRSRRRDGGPPPGLSSFANDDDDNPSLVSPRSEHPYQELLKGPGNRRRNADGEHSVHFEEDEREHDTEGLGRKVGRKLEAIYNEMDASHFSSSEAIAEQLELAWMQQEEEDESLQPLSPYTSPDHAKPIRTKRRWRDKNRNEQLSPNSLSPNAPGAPGLKRCDTSELVREHRNRRPTVLIEADEVEGLDSEMSGSDVDQTDWSKPSLRTIDKIAPSAVSKSVPEWKNSSFEAAEMDGSYSNSEAFADQVERAWFLQQHEDSSGEVSQHKHHGRAMESPYSSTLRSGGHYEDESSAVSEEGEEQGGPRGLSKTVGKKLEALYNDMDASFSNSEAIAEQFEQVWFRQHQGDDDDSSLPNSDSRAPETPYSASHHAMRQREEAPHEGGNPSQVSYERQELQQDDEADEEQEDMELSQAVQQKQYEIIKTLQANNKELLARLWESETNAETEIEELQQQVEAQAAKISELELANEELKEERVVLLQTTDMLRFLLKEAEALCDKQRSSVSHFGEKEEEKKVSKEGKQQTTKTSDNKQLIQKVRQPSSELSASADITKLRKELETQTAKIKELELECLEKEISMEEMKEEKSVLLQSLETLGELLKETEAICEKQRSLISQLDVFEYQKTASGILRAKKDLLEVEEEFQERLIKNQNGKDQILNLKKKLAAGGKGASRPMKSISTEKTVEGNTESTLATMDEDEGGLVRANSDSVDSDSVTSETPTVSVSSIKDKGDRKSAMRKKQTSNLGTNDELSVQDLLQLLSFTVPDQ